MYSSCVRVLAALGVVTACACSSTAPASSSRPPVAGSSVPAPAAFAWRLPPGMPVPKVPPDNPMSDAKVRLGRHLFYDTRLSGNRTMSCATCHGQARAFTDGRAQAIGSTGAVHPRSTMTLTNVAYNASYGWADGKTRTLEMQIHVPMFNEHPIEMGLKGREPEIVARFADVPADRTMFREAFPDEQTPVTFPNIIKAIAAFERVLVSGNSALDRYLYRDERSALSRAAVRGMKLFFSDRLACGRCHSGVNLAGPSDHEAAPTPATPTFHNTGLYNVDGNGAYPPIDRGLFDVTHARADMGRFRAPTLRNIALTAPYMHDGSVPTLELAIAHYASGGLKSPLKSPHVKGFKVTRQDTADLVAFLESLTDREFVTNPAFGPPSADPEELR
jgi:cytochrome c peroxidase